VTSNPETNTISRLEKLGFDTGKHSGLALVLARHIHILETVLEPLPEPDRDFLLNTALPSVKTLLDQEQPVENIISAVCDLMHRFGRNRESAFGLIKDISILFERFGFEALDLMVHRVAETLGEITYRYLRTLKLLVRTGCFSTRDELEIFRDLVFPETESDPETLSGHGPGNKNSLAPETGSRRRMEVGMLEYLEAVFREVLPRLVQAGIAIKKDASAGDADTGFRAASPEARPSISYADLKETGILNMCRQLVHFGGYKINFTLFFKIFFTLTGNDLPLARKLIRWIDVVNGRLEFNGYSVAAFYKDLTNRKYRVVDRCARNGRQVQLFKTANAIMKHLEEDGAAIYPNPELLDYCLEAMGTNRKNYSLLPQRQPELFRKSALYSRARRLIDYRHIVLSLQLTYQIFPHQLQADMVPKNVINQFSEVMTVSSLETFRVENFIRLLNEHSQRPILVVGNLRLGRIYTDPLRQACGDLKGVEFTYARLGSTELTNRIYVTVNPFDRRTTLRLLKQRPHVVVVDASIQNRFPYAFKGFTNFFAAINDVLTGTPGFPNFAYTCHHPEEKALDNTASYRSEYTYRIVRSKLRRMAVMNDVTGPGEPYRLFHLSHPSLADVVLRAGFDETEPMVMNRGTNRTNLDTNCYHPTLVSGRFFNDLPERSAHQCETTDFEKMTSTAQTTDRDDFPMVFLINAFFPFDVFYPGRTADKLAGLNVSLDELGVHTSLEDITDPEERQGTVSFDDLDRILLENTRGVTQAINADGEAGSIRLANDSLMKRLTEVYLDFKKKYWK